MDNVATPAVDRFWPKVFKLPHPGCWLWTAGRDPSGYGMFFDGTYLDTGSPRMVRAHRFAWFLTGSVIGDGLELDHICGVRHCVNPAHLRPVSRKQNQENLTAPKQRRNNTTGYRGVVRVGRQRDHFAAQVMHQGRTIKRGWFSTPEEAAELARQMRLELFTHNDPDRL